MGDINPFIQFLHENLFSPSTSALDMFDYIMDLKDFEGLCPQPSYSDILEVYSSQRKVTSMIKFFEWLDKISEDELMLLLNIPSIWEM